MNFIFFIILILIFILLVMLFKDQGITVTILCSVIIIIIIIDPKVCINAAISGAILFFNKVFPSLFPFLVLSGLILAYDGVHIYSKLIGPLLCRPLRLPKNCSFVLVISALCGYPLGAKYACDLYEGSIIDRNTCERLINIASNPSPLFIIGAVGTSMLRSTTLGYLLLASTYLSCFVMGIIIPVTSETIFIDSSVRKSAKKINFGNAIKGSIQSAIETCLTICGFVTIFSVINSILKSSTIFYTALNKISNIFAISFNLLQGTFLGIIEMTNGCNELSSINLSLKLKIVIISFLLAFSGISVIFQVYSFTYKYNFSLKKYVFFKFIQGIASSLISLILFNITKMDKSLPSLNMLTGRANKSSFYIIPLLAIAMLLPHIMYKLLNRLFHSF